jgi:hypothetical protein
MRIQFWLGAIKSAYIEGNGNRYISIQDGEWMELVQVRDISRLQTNTKKNRGKSQKGR